MNKQGRSVRNKKSTPQLTNTHIDTNMITQKIPQQDIGITIGDVPNHTHCTEKATLNEMQVTTDNSQNNKTLHTYNLTSRKSKQE